MEQCAKEIFEAFFDIDNILICMVINNLKASASGYASLIKNNEKKYNYRGYIYKNNIKNQIFGFNLHNPLLLLVILIFGAPLGEELGWRGFVLPKFRKGYTSLLSGIIVGVSWACYGSSRGKCR